MYVRLDCDWLSIGSLEVRRHTCRHDKKWMKANKHIHRTTPGKPCCFCIQWCKLSEMFVNEAHHDQM